MTFSGSGDAGSRITGGGIDVGTTGDVGAWGSAFGGDGTAGWSAHGSVTNGYAFADGNGINDGECGAYAYFSCSLCENYVMTSQIPPQYSLSAGASAYLRGTMSSDENGGGQGGVNVTTRGQATVAFGEYW